MSSLSRTHKAARRGFTLVEILIVVIILGILAAIVIPQFTSASEDARKNSTKSLLQTIRSQTELFKMEHGDQYPTTAGTAADAANWQWGWMTGKTDFSAGTTSTGTTYGPYLQQEPRNPLNGNTTVAAAPGAGVGFVLTADGKIFATGKVDTNYFHEDDGSESTTVPN